MTTDVQTTSAPQSLWPKLKLLPLEICIRWQRPNRIPHEILGNVLRGAFGITFRRLVCPPEWMNNPCKSCPLYKQCPYGEIFEPAPPAETDRLSKQVDLPRPFVLKPAGFGSDANFGSGLDVATGNASNTALTFGLVLFGRAIDSLPHFVVTLTELGRVGMGRDRVPFTVENIAACLPADVLPSGAQPLYDPSTHQLHRPERFFTERDLLALGGKGQAGSRLTVHFRTPTLLKTGSRVMPDGRRIPAREIRTAPPFGPLLCRLRDRLAALCHFFGETPWSRDDFADLGNHADTVKLLDSDTIWHDRHRRSTKTGQRHPLSGLTGTATYEIASPAGRADFLPLLRFANLMHVGKHAVWGNGWLTVEDIR